MTVTLNIIIEFLKAHRLAEPMAAEPCDEPFLFDRTILLGSEGAPGLTAPSLFSGDIPELVSSADTLFIGTEEQVALFAQRGNDKTRMLCVCSNESDARMHDKDERVFQVRSSKGASEIFAAVCQCEAVLASWVELMERDLLEGKGYQGIMDRAEAIIGNPMILSDVGFRILAYTRRLVVPEKAVQEAIERGSFSHSSMESFRRKGRPRAWRSFFGINILDQPTEERPYPVVNYVFRVQGRYFMHLVMHCSEVPYSFGLRDLLQMLVDAMEMQIRRVQAGSFFEEGSSLALARLVAGAPSSQLLRTLESAGINREGRFRIIVFDHGYRNEEPQLPVYAAFTVMEEMPFLLVGVLEGRIVGLWAASGEHDDSDKIEEALRRYCRQYDCYVGVSDDFNLLVDAPFAFRQAAFALEAADRRRQPCLADGLSQSEEEKSNSVFTFDEGFTDFVVLSSEGDEDLLEYCVTTSVPAKLASAVSRSSIDDFALLRAYLEAGSRPSVASDAVHMHRTTLLYRLDRIAKRFSIDLSDSVRTQRLSMEYRLMDLGYGRSRTE